MHLGLEPFGKGVLTLLRWIKKVPGRVLISREEGNTLHVELEVVMNDTPLTYPSGELTEPEAITPSHFIYGHQINPLPLFINNKDLENPEFKPKEIISTICDHYTCFSFK